MNNIDTLPDVMSLDTPHRPRWGLEREARSWGCVAANTKGNLLHEVLLDHDFLIEAPPEPTHHPSAVNHRPDILDIFVTRGISLDRDPYVIPELSSDHSPVILEIDGHLDRTTPVSTKIDWLNLKFLLENSHRCSPIRSTTEIDQALADLTAEIRDAIQRSTTTVPATREPTKLPSSILHLLEEKNRVRKLWQRFRKPLHRAKLNSLQCKLDVELGSTSDAAFESYIAQAEASPKSAWKVIKSLRTRKPHLPPLKKDGRSFTLDGYRAEIFVDSLRDQCSPFPSSPDHAPFHAEVTESVRNFTPTDGDFSPASPAEIAKIIGSLRNNKAPGSDSITNGVLQSLPRKQVVTLCNVVNAMMRLNYFPPAWKEATVICLPKAGKPLSAPSSFRPISLLSAMSKIAESVILSRLNNFIERNSIIPHFQHGFLKRHGSGHQLLRVGEFISDKFNRRQHTSMLLLDARQVFGRVCHEGLIYKMTSLNFPHYLIALTQFFLSGQRIRVRDGRAVSEAQGITAGVPQGSKLSPILFNIYCYDIPTDDKVMIAQYADDVALIYSCSTIKHGTRRLNNYLRILLDWYSMWRFEINETKSEAVFFSRRNRFPPNIVVNSHEVPWSPSAKYLRVTFDRKLT